ncbi:Palmitoyltransferase [Aphelenchoides besseyi]|nr:Palmitoyltransferase [Aphelenchoides besseyi]
MTINWKLRLWLQPFLWTSAYIFWYHLFCTAFMGVLLDARWFWTILIYLGFALIWILAAGSLYKALFTRPLLIPLTYRVPDEVLGLLSYADLEEYANFEKAYDSEDDTNSTFETEDEGGDQVPKEKSEKWEVFYRKLIEISDKFRSKVRTTPMTFGDDEFDCPLVCVSCKILKPQRTHHCRHCNRCVVRFDHCCPALGTCIHLANHKFFMLLLVHATFKGIYCSVFMASFLIYICIDFYSPGGVKLQQMAYPLAFAITGCGQATLFPFILTFFQWSFWSDIFDDHTTIETIIYGYDEEEQNETVEKKSGAWLRNVETLFGSRRSLWLLPIQTANLQI